MTTKEIAVAVNKDERSVRRWVKKSADKMTAIKDKMTASSPMKPADYTLDETIAIIETGLGKNAAAIFKQNAEQKQNIKPAEGGVLTQKDLELVAAIVANAFNMIARRVSAIENKIEQRRELLPAPSASPRDEINRIIRSYSTKNSIPYSIAYNQLYSEAYYRLHVNLALCAKNRNMPVLDYAEEIEVIPELLSIAVEKFS